MGLDKLPFTLILAVGRVIRSFNILNKVLMKAKPFHNFAEKSPPNRVKGFFCIQAKQYSLYCVILYVFSSMEGPPYIVLSLPSLDKSGLVFFNWEGNAFLHPLC